MTTFTALPNPAVAAGGLPSGETVTALRDNPVAMFEGDATAPKLSPRALEAALTAGTTFMVENTTTFTATVAGTFVNETCMVGQFGAVKMRVTFGGSQWNYQIQRRRNGTWTTLDSANDQAGTQNRNVDIGVQPGDYLRARVTKSNSGATDATITYFALGTNGEKIWPFDESQGGNYNSVWP